MKELKKNGKYGEMERWLYPAVFDSADEAFRTLMAIKNKDECKDDVEWQVINMNPIVMESLDGKGFLVDLFEHAPALLEDLNLREVFNLWEAARAMGYEYVDGKYVQTRTPEELIAWFETGAGEKLTNRMKEIQSFFLK